MFSGRRLAFSLTELLVSIGIMVVLISMMLPAIQKVRESSKRLECSQNLHQLGVALHNWHSIYGFFPLANAWAPSTAVLEQDGDGTTPAKILKCPSRTASAFRIDYAASYRMDSSMGGFSPPSGWQTLRLSEILGGLSNTVLLAEKQGLARASVSPPQGNLGVVDTTGLVSTMLASGDSTRPIISDSAQVDSTDFTHATKDFTGVNYGYTDFLSDDYNTTGAFTTLDDPPQVYVFGGWSAAPCQVDWYRPRHVLGFGSCHPGSMNTLMGDGSVQHFLYGRTGLGALMSRTEFKVEPEGTVPAGPLAPAFVLPPPLAPGFYFLW